MRLTNTHTNLFLLVASVIALVSCGTNPDKEGEENIWIRINQLGYVPSQIKVAVLVGTNEISCFSFSVHNAQDGKKFWKSNDIQQTGGYGPFRSTFRLDFSDFNEVGEFYVKSGNTISPKFTIGNAYKGTADHLLKYMRQQRCGYNPFLKDSCHLADGYTMYGPMPDSTHLDVTGGWHDASDYLQYAATSVNATYNMLFAFRENPQVFTDKFQTNGLEGKNGIPDILDEANWGLEWMLKMHPKDNWMFNQIADDRDHSGYRLPNNDTTSYGKGLERPVYFCSGEVQGLFGNLNRATGTASTAGKFASAFAIGSVIYRDKDPSYTELLISKATSAYKFGLNNPGVSQTAPGTSPYFYEEDNWHDDMELAAAALYNNSKDDQYLKEALKFSKEEKVTPWLEADTARHYQWYPFINLGHYELASNLDGDKRQELIEYYERGIEAVWKKAKTNGFLRGVPFIWCSNNLTASFATQCYLYRKLSGDNQYQELEAATIDWLFGCNPWGTSMIIGLPNNGVYPRNPHSSLTVLHDYPLDGGLVDGPVNGNIYNGLIGITLYDDDEYDEFQSNVAVYHDDAGDYSTNEPTMDGTAILMYLLSSLEADGM